MKRFGGFGVAAALQQQTPAELDQRLGRIAAAGFDHVELSPSAWDVVINGRVNSRCIERFRKILDRYRDKLQFTVHGPIPADIFNLADCELHERTLHAFLDVTVAFGAKVLVYHPKARDAWPNATTRPLRDLLARERDFLQQLGDRAAASGVVIAMETMDPMSDGQTLDAYGSWPDRLALQVEAIAHPAVGICLDTGHLFLAANWHGFDFLDGVRRIAPHVAHFHLQDNCGRLRRPPAEHVTALGIGDLHLPPGWGDVPFDAMFANIEFPRAPVLLLELDWARYEEDMPDLLSALHRWNGTTA